MNRIIFLLLSTSIHLFAFNDYDIDGVSDKVDRCPNTPFNELVDINGCTIKSLKSPHNFGIIYGVDYSQKNYDTMEDTNTISQSLQLDYYYKNFSLQASSSYYSSQDSTNDSGMNDSFLGAYYKLPTINNLSLRLGIGIILPTYKTDSNNNNTDYTSSLNISYMLKDANLFGGYSYTIINDDDIDTTLVYQNTSSYSAGIGIYPSSKLYVSAAYTSADSIYTDQENIDILSFNAFYKIDKNWFSTLNYAYGLSDSARDHYAALKIGYYF